MKQFQVYQLLMLILLTTKSIEALKLAKKGCEEKCGEVGIPFPFGIGPRCSLDERYNVDCNSSKPYLSAFDNMEVLNISLQQQTITVNVSMTFDCQNRVLNSSQILISTINPHRSVSPFLFSRLQNIFVAEGCGNAVITDYGNTVTGCSTTCHNDTFIDRNHCYGMGCCQATLPYYFKQFTLNLTGLERRSADGTCGSAFLVKKDLFFNGSFYRKSIDRNHYFVPISLFWPLADMYMDDHPVFKHPECSMLSFHLNDGSLEGYIKCQCNITHEGNPYLPNGCRKNEECKQCERHGGICGRRLGIYDDATLKPAVILACDMDFSYIHKVSLGVILVERLILVNNVVAEFSMEPFTSKKGMALVEKAKRKAALSNTCWQNAYQNLFAGCSEILAAEEQRSSWLGILLIAFRRTLGGLRFLFVM